MPLTYAKSACILPDRWGLQTLLLQDCERLHGSASTTGIHVTGRTANARLPLRVTTHACHRACPRMPTETMRLHAQIRLPKPRPHSQVPADIRLPARQQTSEPTTNTAPQASMHRVTTYNPSRVSNITESSRSRRSLPAARRQDYTTTSRRRLLNVAAIGAQPCMCTLRARPLRSTRLCVPHSTRRRCHARQGTALEAPWPPQQLTWHRCEAGQRVPPTTDGRARQRGRATLQSEP